MTCTIAVSTAVVTICPKAPGERNVSLG